MSISREVKILVVDDEPAITSTLARLLRMRGYTVAEALCVRDALSLAEKERFDLLLSDLQLPDGDGTEVLAGVRQRSTAKAIAITAVDPRDAKDRVLAAGFDLYLCKPVPLDLLLKTVRIILEQPETGEN